VAVGEKAAVSAQGTPPLSLPKGGGAVRGIGEKFAANPVTGTGSMSVPLNLSPGRSGFGPQLALSYDSGSGNGSFGFGWSMSSPAITRRTDKGLPRYEDGLESDVFVLSGCEDLVPILLPTGERAVDTSTDERYTIHRYRPRVDSTFARIERWTRRSDGDVHWRSLSRDNVLTVYGADAASRILAEDPEGREPDRVFSWLISESRDDRGNAILYDYKLEDDAGVDVALASERHRTAVTRRSNRYLKRIRYGNRRPLLGPRGQRPVLLTDLPAAQLAEVGWLFEAVLDYGEHGVDVPTPVEVDLWTSREDPFSSYRAGFEVRTSRLCRRVLMFHHVPDQDGVSGYDGLVRSTTFAYELRNAPTEAGYTFLRSVTHSGHRRVGEAYRSRSLPSVEFEYTRPVVEPTVQTVAPAMLEHLPVGVNGERYQWVDLHGEGIPGVFTEQAGAWFYSRNVSPGAEQEVALGPLEQVAAKPNLNLAGASATFIDLAGDGLLDLVLLDGPGAGLFEHDEAEGWQPFRPFTSRLSRDLRGSDVRFVDLDGDGHADVLVLEDEAIVWNQSLGEAGFGPAQRVPRPVDEEEGPRLVFADGTRSVYLADLSGDGLADLVRLRNGEICYWPNLGHGRFGRRVTMDGLQPFDQPDQFDQRRIRLADVDGSGTTDVIYLHRDGVRLYFNRSGNSWSTPVVLPVFPRVDDVVSITTADLLGNGTVCLVWSSPLPGDAGRQMRYLNLIGDSKPHLLSRMANNLGAETQVRYAPSTKFYLQDKAAGRPWATRLPFPVHVVERVETLDRISHNRFVTRYAYHDGYFDGEEREFRGFAWVDQWDTEELGGLTATGTLPDPEPTTDSDGADNASHLPPTLTRTWFHAGITNGPSNLPLGALAQPVLPDGLSAPEQHEAARALKGTMLRREIYALDGSARARFPYSVTELTHTVRLEQPRGGNPHAVFSSHPVETLEVHTERNPDDPRVQHSFTLEVDAFGNVLKSASVGYGRTASPLALEADRRRQTTTLLTYTENTFTNAVDDPTLFPFAHRAPLPADARTDELTDYPPSGRDGRYLASDFVAPDPQHPERLRQVFDHVVDYAHSAKGSRCRRPIEWSRTLYRADDLSMLLPLGVLEPRALPGESYQLALTPALLTDVFLHDGVSLLPVPAVLGAASGVGGGYRSGDELTVETLFPATDPDGLWWLPSGRVLLSPRPGDTAVEELDFARQHFFAARRSRDPFHSAEVSTESVVDLDLFDLLTVETKDPLGNRVQASNDYRALQPYQVTDPNGNRTEVAFDALGMVVATAVMGKPGQLTGDSLATLDPDLDEAQVIAHLEDPLGSPGELLGSATTRVVYDLWAFQRSRDTGNPRPVAVSTLTRRVHVADLSAADPPEVSLSFSYSDGFGRELQQKVRAEPGPVTDGGPTVDPRWVGTGWSVFNNKGLVVRKYEPFFTDSTGFEFDVRKGVSPVTFYDPVGRVVANLHPDHTYQKVVFDSWQQVTWDANDTVLDDPRTDADIAGYVAGYFAALPEGPDEPPWQTWHEQRQGPGPGQLTAAKAAAHARTPTTVHADVLGRAFLTMHDNGPDPEESPTHQILATRIDLDIEGNHRATRDAVVQAEDPAGRIVSRADFDLLGHRIRQRGMESGCRWTLNDASGRPLRRWDDRGHTIRTEYDALRRPLRSFVSGADPDDPGREQLTERLVYGEQHPEAEQRNLRGALYLHLDQAGALSTQARDAQGNLVEVGRRLTRGTSYRALVDWQAVDDDPHAVPPGGAHFEPAALEAVLATVLEPETYTGRTTYDALNRPVLVTTPSTPGAAANTIRTAYNEANLVEQIEVNLRGVQKAGEPVWTPLVRNVDYDSNGHRRRIDYGNGASTLFDYDPLTFRLVRLLTVRDPAGFPADDPRPPSADSPGSQVQDLRYSYDPVGNVTSIRDHAQQRIFFANRRVEPSVDYTYDALYRLIQANGREHLGQTGAPIPHSADDALRTLLPHPGDGSAMGNYRERYTYDAVGNLLSLQHVGSSASQPGWIRAYEYAETSLIEDGTAGTSAKTGNRLTSTNLSGPPVPPVEHYRHDAHGNVTRVPHLGGSDPDPNLRWDHHDQLTQVDLGGGGTAYYVYDAAGQRVRKVWEKPGDVVEERVYLGGVELYRRRLGDARLERETLHVMHERERVALVETRVVDTAGADRTSAQLVRYQHGNHLGSACLELDQEARIVSYEEFSPYGSTTYQAAASATEAPKRYRFTGKERDEETGFGYHGARYCAPWLGRWMACDPAEPRDTTSTYAYGADNPVRYMDPDGMAEQDLIGGFLSSAASAYTKVKTAVKADVGDVAEYARQGAARWGDEALRVARQTEAEHPVAGAAAKALNPRYVYRKAVTIVIDRPVAVAKTAGDLRMIKAVKAGAMGAEELAARSKANFVKAVANRWAQTGSSTSQLLKDAKKVAEVTEESAREALPSLGRAQRAVSPAVRRAGQEGFAEVGLIKGIAGTGFAAVTGLLSYKELKEDLKKKDYASAIASGAGVAASGVSLFAKGAALVTGVSSVPLTAAVGGMSAGEAIAAAPHVVGAFAFGAAAGVGIEKVFPEYTQHAADIGSRTEKLTGSTIGGGVATVAAVLPLVWALTKGYDLATK